VPPGDASGFVLSSQGWASWVVGQSEAKLQKIVLLFFLLIYYFPKFEVLSKSIVCVYL
jgi:hypothetical protein